MRNHFRVTCQYHFETSALNDPKITLITSSWTVYICSTTSSTSATTPKSNFRLFCSMIAFFQIIKIFGFPIWYNSKSLKKKIVKKNRKLSNSETTWPCWPPTACKKIQTFGCRRIIILVYFKLKVYYILPIHRKSCQS